MPTLGPYWFSQTCAWGFTCSYALLALAGVIASQRPNAEFLALNCVDWCVGAFAALVVFAILGVNVTAPAIMHALTGPGGWKAPHWPTLIPTVVCMSIYMSASYLGMHLGWEALRTDGPGAALANEPFVQPILSMLPWAKPLSMLAISGRESLDQTRLDEEKRAEQARAERAAQLDRESRVKVQIARIEAKSKRDQKPGASKTAKDKREPETAQSQKPKPTAEARKRGLSMLKQGYSAKEAAEATGVPYQTLKGQAWRLNKRDDGSSHA